MALALGEDTELPPSPIFVMGPGLCFEPGLSEAEAQATNHEGDTPSLPTRQDSKHWEKDKLFLFTHCFLQ